MTEKKYELHIWYRRWQLGATFFGALPGAGPWLDEKVVLRYENNAGRDNQIDRILRNEWWLEDRLIPFRDVLRMERREAGK